MKEIIVTTLAIVIMCILGFVCGVDYAKEKGCKQFNGVYIGSHCLKPDTLMFTKDNHAVEQQVLKTNMIGE